MISDARLQVHSQFVAARYKYAYFLLTAAGAGIILAINNTNSVVMTYSQIPLGCAVLFWGFSFYSGCRFVLDANSALYSDLVVTTINDGVHPMSGNNPNLQKTLKNEVNKGATELEARSRLRASRQFRFLVIGAVLYLVWHIIEMLVRSLN